MGYNINLKIARKKAGYTQKQVADMLGISQNNYSYWEQGKVNINSSYLEQLSKIFDCKVEELLNIDEEEKKKANKTVEEIFDKEFEMIDIIQSDKNKGSYYFNLDYGERFTFIFLLLMSKEELALHKLYLQAQKENVNPLEWYIDGKLPRPKFDNDEQ